jgi:hypothetical protein
MIGALGLKEVGGGRNVFGAAQLGLNVSPDGSE